MMASRCPRQVVWAPPSPIAPAAQPGNPYDGHALASAIDATEKLTGCAIERPVSTRIPDTANPRRASISGQKRVVFGIIKRDLRRRSAIEPVIG